MIDIAKLTGALFIALGSVCAGVSSTDNGLTDALFASGERTFERVWRLPLDETAKEMRYAAGIGIGYGVRLFL